MLHDPIEGPQREEREEDPQTVDHGPLGCDAVAHGVERDDGNQRQIPQESQRTDEGSQRAPRPGPVLDEGAVPSEQEQDRHGDAEEPEGLEHAREVLEVERLVDEHPIGHIEDLARDGREADAADELRADRGHELPGADGHAAVTQERRRQAPDQNEQRLEPQERGHYGIEGFRPADGFDRDGGDPQLGGGEGRPSKIDRQSTQGPSLGRGVLPGSQATEHEMEADEDAHRAERDRGPVADPIAEARPGGVLAIRRGNARELADRAGEPLRVERGVALDPEHASPDVVLHRHEGSSPVVGESVELRVQDVRRIQPRLTCTQCADEPTRAQGLRESRPGFVVPLRLHLGEEVLQNVVFLGRQAEIPNAIQHHG